jgi:hypothetical protein
VSSIRRSGASGRGRGRNPASLAAIQPPPNAAPEGNLRSVRHGAYSKRLKAPRVREVMDELAAEHSQEAPANLRALAELYVTAERLSDWVAERADGGICTNGAIAPAALEARKAWALYLEKARDLGITTRGRRELAALPAETSPGTRLARHLRGEDEEV